jgi:hypothetical protein
VSNLRVLPVVLVMTLLSGPFSHARGQNPLPPFSFVGLRVFDSNGVRLRPVSPGGSLTLALSGFFDFIRVCITEASPGENCEPFNENLPAGIRLRSSNPDVASVHSDGRMVAHLSCYISLDRRSCDCGSRGQLWRPID